jgi:type I restriction enzyme, S subunit
MKTGYKQTEVGVIPEEWEVKPLGELASLYQPATISAKQFAEAGYPVYGANGVVGFYHSTNHQTWQVTVTCRGSTCGTVNRTVDECWITGNAMVLNCDQNKDISKDFFYYLLLGQDMSVCITGTGQPQIVRSPLSAFRVAVPKRLPEQRAIATALSDVDALLAALDRLIAKKRDLKQAAMQQLLTGQTRLPGFNEKWETKRVLDLGEVVTGGTPRTDVAIFWGNDYPWITPTDISAHRDMFTSERTITRKGLDSIRALPPNTVLVTCIASIGKNAILRTAGACNQQINAVTPNKNNSAEFLYYVFEASKQYLQANAGTTATSIISKATFAQLTFTVPPLPEQTAIATVLSDMDVELAALEQRRDKTRALKQGMMQELLTGRTRLV